MRKKFKFGYSFQASFQDAKRLVSYPALKRRAIFRRPGGRRREMNTTQIHYVMARVACRFLVTDQEAPN